MPDVIRHPELVVEEVDLESMSRAKLWELAEERGIEVPSKVGKTKLIALLGGKSLEGALPVIRAGLDPSDKC